MGFWFSAETFAKPVTDGVSAARRHFEKSVMLCLISVGDEPSPLHFRFQAAVGGFAKVSGCLHLLRIHIYMPAHIAAFVLR